MFETPAALLILLAATVATVLAVRPDWRRRALDRFWPLPSWLLVTATFAIATFAFESPGAGLFAAGVVAFLLLAIAWWREASILVRLDDDAFPGRHDKLVWALLLIALPPVGVALFRSFRREHGLGLAPETKATAGARVTSDLA